ncbi:PD-(D/E)XK nuclease family protein [uncultured Dokdonia sp.]|uniref:PD-(D/E)XK nuclease family protein n=1 Tax=uncultured Dokdonia sp. TaxID=575653 RepID=UPI0026133B11|nr:PD-(D/E)XK nuclease family protein [uncultured Dokdonia sp.]
MQSFIDVVLNKEQNIEGANLIFIVPSRRAGNTLRKKVAVRASKTSFAPQIFSIEEFISHITGLKSASNVDLIFNLYESYTEVVEKEKLVPFQTFCGWAQSILSDFNEVDRFLLDQKEVFNHLKDVKELSEHWSSSTNEIVVNYIDFWNNLLKIYTVFCEKSLRTDAVHQGYIYRQAVEVIEHYISSSLEIRHVFLGFNALNTAEQQIIQAILASGNSEIYWDTEKSFVKNPYHETNLFIKKYKKDWAYYSTKDFSWSFDNYSIPKVINTYACSQDILQAKTLGSILESIPQKSLSSTAIVLGDEALLLPVLNALPTHIHKVNITMGIPIGKTPTASFFDQLLSLKKNPQKSGYYFKEVLKILRNPITQSLLGDTATVLQEEIITKNLIYVSLEDILTKVKPTDLQITKTLFLDWDNQPKSAVTNCLNIIQELRTSYDESKDALQVEYLYGFYVAFNKLKTLMDDRDHITDVATFILFYRDIISSETIDLKGDPDEGLQIMGVLESRVLDYEHVILTSVNEGILPSGKSQNSYIPYDLKKLYDLPTYSEKDAVYAYHFYHLLHRARTADLLYTTHSTGLGSSEQSRFIRQIEEEGIHTIHKYTVTPASQPATITAQKIEKTPEVITKLSRLFKKGISPSALTTYLRNPVVFYERYILGIDNSDEVEETVAANTMGTIVHNTLEELYKPHIGIVLTEDILKNLIKGIEPEVRNQFKLEYGLTHIQEGKNKIIYAVICRYVHNYLKREISLLKKGDVVIIQAVEDDLRDIPLTDTVSLRGKVDLVEQRNGNLNIVDYKTGKVAQTDLNLKSYEDLLLPEGKFEKAFQVLMYAYMLNKKKPLSFPVSAGIISFKNLQSGFLAFKYNKNQEITAETLLEFEAVLKRLVKEILDPSIPFTER